MTRMHVKTTAELEWDSLGVIRSARRRASFESWGMYDISDSRMYACDHLDLSAWLLFERIYLLIAIRKDRYDLGRTGVVNGQFDVLASLPYVLQS